MSQSDFGDIDPSATSGTELANTILEPFRDALHSMHKGSSRPGYAVAGLMWLDDSAEPWVVKVYDGGADRVLAEINPTSGVVRFTGVVGSSGTPVTSVDANTIREAGTRVAKGAASAVDNALPRFNGTSGHQLQASGIVVDDNDNISGHGMVIDVKAGDFTLAAADKGKTLECDDASSTGMNVTVPDNATVSLPVGYSVSLVQVNTGDVTVVEDSGVTVQNNSSLTLNGQWAAATLYKRATNEWVLSGDLA